MWISPIHRFPGSKFADSHVLSSVAQTSTAIIVEGWFLGVSFSQISPFCAYMYWVHVRFPMGF